MIELNAGAGTVVAADVRTAFASVDESLLNQARMTVSVLEATQGADIPAGQKQKLLRSLSDSMAAMVEGRSSICAALGEMLKIKQHSNLSPVSYGCPIGWEDLKASAAPAAMPVVEKTLA